MELYHYYEFSKFNDYSSHNITNFNIIHYNYNKLIFVMDTYN